MSREIGVASRALQRVEAEPLGQPVATGPAQEQPAAIDQQQIAVAVGPGEQRFHAVDPHDRRTMDAREFGGIEPLLDVAELTADEMDGPADVNAQIVAATST